ncbi:hypothetical protein RVF87_17935 [Gordonia hydrophobica]|uniref:Uncharacterized protein n=1 Tax=Gordonia hydrophobica TaxID=40516 RepID=A0ABZ2TZN7_9ACTN|nr:hypothetical protein [Gordonia hydrophobica]MBM7369274.1 hypothetical protein [Gordonia hydrophobica]
MGTRLDTTNAAEARNPAAVPANSQWKSITLINSAASNGLSNVSIVEASWEYDRARVESHWV